MPKQPYYRLVAIDKRAARDAAEIEADVAAREDADHPPPLDDRDARDLVLVHEPARGAHPLVRRQRDRVRRLRGGPGLV